MRAVATSVQGYKFALMALGTVCTLGCWGGASDRPDLGRVTGTVTLDGRTIDGARISFWPQNGGRGSQAVTRPDGTYTLYYDREEGAKIGSHVVKITTFAAAGDGFAGRAEEIPRKYNRNTTLEVEVEPGAQTIDFPLEDDPKEKKWQPVGDVDER